MKRTKGKTVLYRILLLIFLLASGVIFPLTEWFAQNFGVTIEAIIFTILSPIEGADTDFLGSAVRYCLPAFFGFAGLFLVWMYIEWRVSRRIRFCVSGFVGRKKVMRDGMWIYRAVSLGLALVIFAGSLLYANRILGFSDYVEHRLKKSRIYEEYYIDPKTVTIKAGEKKKNLIYIYMESMETTYASVEDGGYQPETNYIPRLTELARENISFSNDDLLGGFHSIYGTGWTMAALFATSTGVPFAFPTENNSMNEREEFAGGITGLGDLLKQEGYHQEFLCGSDASYGGRQLFFQNHGNYEIFDYQRTMEEGYIEQGYKVWWGFEDRYLYQIARDELERLSKEEEPFNLTLLTVDTHHMHGYNCALCGTDFEENLANVVRCADLQAAEFVAWCQQQEWYDDTVIVISGDHPRMDTDLIGEMDYNDRTIYNCFIHTGKDKETLAMENREFTTMDMFPTVLSALGYEIEGNRLGLGTNLFSQERTLAEQMGISELDAQLSRYSDFYVKNFK